MLKAFGSSLVLCFGGSSARSRLSPFWHQRFPEDARLRLRTLCSRGFSMIARLIEFSLRHRAGVIAVYLVVAVWGAIALRTSPVDAIPDLSDPQVIVFSDWSGHSAQEVE